MESILLIVISVLLIITLTFLVLILRKISNPQSVMQDVSPELREKVNRLDETNNKILGFTEDLQTLTSVMLNSKKRGSLGEQSLQAIVDNILPPTNTKFQYSFPNENSNYRGEAVDLAILLEGEKILPIDSKFPLESYKAFLVADTEKDKNEYGKTFISSVKQRIDETAKYIKPSQGTVDFAIMYIPSEAIYYDLLNGIIGNENVIEYAIKKKNVVITGPSTLAAYLLVILQGLNNLKAEKKVRDLQKLITSLDGELETYNKEFESLTSSFNANSNKLSSLTNRWSRIKSKLSRIEDQE